MEEEVYKYPEYYPGDPQAQIIARLAVLQHGQDHCISRVNKINGSIKELYGKAEKSREDLLIHMNDCPLRDRVDEINNMLIPAIEDPLRISALNIKVVELEKTVAAQEAQKKEAARWVHMLQPLILGFGAALLSTVGTLVLLHSSSFVKSIAAQQAPAAQVESQRDEAPSLPAPKREDVK